MRVKYNKLKSLSSMNDNSPTEISEIAWWLKKRNDILHSGEYFDLCINI